MPELNLATLNVAPTNNAASPPARGKDTDSGASGTPFGAVMTQAATQRASPPQDTSGHPTKTEESSEAHPQRPGQRMEKAARIDAAHARKRHALMDRLVDTDAADAKKQKRKVPSEPAADAPIATGAAGDLPVSEAPPPEGMDTKGIETAANMLATLAAAQPATPAVAHATAQLPQAGQNPDAPPAQEDADVTPAMTQSALPSPHARHADAAGTALPQRIQPEDMPTTHTAREPSGGRDPGAERATALSGRDDARMHRARPSDTHEPAALHANAAAPQRDRLIEDFQQRFERALTTAASSGTATPRSDPGLVQSAAAPAWTGASQTDATSSNVMHISVPTPVGTQAFVEDFSNRVTFLTRGRIHSAELSLTPADLGPVTVSIEVRGTDATLVFGATHAGTRAAIEDALPRLREMLNAQGLQLADAHVGTQAGQDDARNGHRPQRSPTSATPGPIDAIGASAANAVAAGISARSTRLIDVIA